VATIRNESKISSFVSCPACAGEIPLEGSPRLPAEFSVPCPSCGRRTIFQSADAHDSKKSEEAANTFGRPRFPAKKKKAKAQAPTARKSWLSECATWLLQ
jgi:predicted RNA-binding Zn-ribbon protein involved in translation (DUF1610 family)